MVSRLSALRPQNSNSAATVSAWDGIRAVSALLQLHKEMRRGQQAFHLSLNLRFLAIIIVRGYARGAGKPDVHDHG
jgi:hypothetical protein